jgi:hypothetical protein
MKQTNLPELGHMIVGRQKLTADRFLLRQICDAAVRLRNTLMIPETLSLY